MKLFLLLLPYLFAGLIYTALAMLIERVMIWSGWFRGNTLLLAVVCFISSSFFELLRFPEAAFTDMTWTFAFLVAVPVGMNRYDLMTTMNKGRWWWKMSNETKNENANKNNFQR